ncbi:MAG: helix-turn-helix transcriptional regulator [Eggerthellaceae bacterium]|nr:helix-turn-helix transcriptional regulator [Eggerthellaceae bacterium]MDR2721351.1 helix-turn-helix transcriptional regulator [Coriobacteriaceae bacterium]
MEQGTHVTDKLSPRRIIGFACNQGFVFFLFYMGYNRASDFGGVTFERAELVGTLLFMVITLLCLRLFSENAKRAVFARPMLLLYALMLAVGSLLPYYVGENDLVGLLVECFLVGLPAALLLSAWGQAFGEAPTKVSVSEVFLASLIAALFGLVVSVVPLSRADLAFRLLPFVSAFTLMLSVRAAGLGAKVAPAADDSVQQTALLSAKIIAGTALFGMAAGFMETFNTDPGMAAMPAYQIALLLLAAFAIGSLSLLLSDGFGKGAALNKSYRLAIFVMMLGFLLVPAPFLVESSVSGEAIVLSGYLGLSAVLISLFLVLASITGTSTTASFSKGFAALFGGEFIGVFLANIIDSVQPDQITPYFVVVFAGMLVLFSYLFLFTERDFGSLSEIVTKTDSFENRCQVLAEQHGLSAREAEILPFVLKGRTSERIAQELFISKSTVETHLQRIYAKANVHSRQELIDLSEL